MLGYATYYVTNIEETRASTLGGPSSYIPTFGAPATAVDQYRIVAVHESNLNETGACFTDSKAAKSLGKLLEGNFDSVNDIISAETALQALLLNEEVHVLVPAPKVNFGDGLISYHVPEDLKRTSLTYELFKCASSTDWLVAPELLSLSDGFVTRSTAKDTKLIGRHKTDINNYNFRNVKFSVNTVVQGLKVPAFFADPEYVLNRRNGFQKRFYHRLKTSWDDISNISQYTKIDIPTPPLLTILLDRLNSREDLRHELVALRDDLKAARSELRRLDDIFDSSLSQPEIERRIRHLEASFSAIVPESRLSDAEKRKRKVYETWELARPIWNVFSAFLLAKGLSPKDLEDTGRIPEAVLRDSRIVNRTITARTFVDLLKSENLQKSLSRLLTDSELNAIENSELDRRITAGN